MSKPTAPQTETQLQMVRNHLHKSTITTIEAIIKYRITRLSEYIRLLREEGYNISLTWNMNNGKRYGVYKLEK